MATAARTDSPKLRRFSEGFRNAAGILQYLAAHYRFKTEPFEMFVEPVHHLADIQTYGFFEGDCDDASTVAASLLLAKGYRVRLKAIRTRAGTTSFQHVFAEYWDRGAWQPADLTVPAGTQHRFLEAITQDV